MSVVCDNKCCGGAKKPERTLRTATACAFWLSIAIILLARSQLASTQHSNKLHKCDDDSCSAPHSLRGAQNLLHAAAHHLTQQHRHAAGASAAVQLVADEAADVGKRQLDVTGKEQLQAGPIAQKPRSGAAASASGSELQAAAARQQVAKTYGGANEDSAAAASLASSEQGRPAPRHEGDAAAVVAAHAAIGAQGQAADQVAGGGQPSQPSAPSPYQLALQGCSDLLCLQRAAALDRRPGQFMFPHFFIVGWQKCATTSLFFHLSQHPAVLRSSQKEPEFFSNECGYSTADCAEEAQKRYISKTLRLEEALEGDLQRSTVEASTHYGRNGHLLAHPLHELMPWLKIVISMREPISRGISMLAHQLDKHDSGCLTSGKSTFHCLERSLTKEGYAKPFQAWLEAYPGQIFLIQYENLTSSEHQVNVLHGLKHWLGIDPELPNSDLGIRNTREYHLKRKGQLAEAESEEANSWPMERGQYELLVDLVRPDAQKVADLAAKYGLADGKVWMRNWEREWQGTLDRCDEDGACIVFPS